MKADHVFVIDVDGRPTLVFDAPGAEVARAFCEDKLLREDLSSMTANGAPICSTHSQISSRAASAREIAAFEYAHRRAPASENLVMVFLIEIDGIVMMSVDL